jgi:hypothetical protein
MVYFQTKNPNLGKLWRVFQLKMLVYFTAIWFILLPFGIFCGHLIHFMFILNIFPILVCCTNKNLATLDETRAARVLNVSVISRNYPG